MTNTKDTGPKTKILKNVPGGSATIATIKGLPYGIPGMGTRMKTIEYGVLKCTGIQKSGSGQDETVDEMTFTVVD